MSQEHPDQRFSGKIVVITGGSRGIGDAVSRAFLREGAIVASLSRTRPFGSSSANFVEYEVDVLQNDSIELALATVANKYNRVDILVNNAGVYCDMRFGADDFPDNWSRVVSTNLSGAAMCTHCALPYFPESGGSIVYVGSAYSEYGHHKSSGYSASKAGVIGLSRSTATELGRRGIRANAVLPGWIDTSMNDGLLGSARGDFICSVTPLGRFGNADEVARAVLFLCSDEARFISGAELRVDGGYFVSDRSYDHR